MPALMRLTGKGMKARIDDFPAEAWRSVMGGAPGIPGDLPELFRRVPWLNRGIALLGNAVASLPFVILNQRGDEVDTSDDYQNLTGLWADPHADLWLAEASMNLTAAAYFKKLRTKGKKHMGLRYLVPATIRALTDAEKGLTGFERTIAGVEPVTFSVEEILYIYAVSPYSEIGQPDDPRALAALDAAGVLKNMAEIKAEFFKSGMIKATVLSIPQETLPADQERISSAWGRLFKGVKAVYDMLVINAGAATPMTIGEGLGDLAIKELTDEQREDVSTALGVPHSLLFSNAANFATANQDALNFYNQTIIPDARRIERAFNEQYFVPSGFRLQFRPDTMDIFQEDEEDRTGSILNLVTAATSGSPKVVRLAYEIMGVELPGGMEYDEFEKLLEKAKAEAPPPDPSAPTSRRPAALTDEERREAQQEGDEPAEKMAAGLLALAADLDRWERKAIKRLKSHPSAACEFESAAIPAPIAILIEEMLAEATTAEQVRAIFAVMEVTE